MFINKISEINNQISNEQEIKNILGKEDFLKLLITELKYQNPLSPVDNKEFISQMAEFSSLEQLQNMNNNFDYLVNILSFSQLNFATSIISKKVVGLDENGNVFEGIVKNVSIEKGNIFLDLDGKKIELKKIIKIY